MIMQLILALAPVSNGARDAGLTFSNDPVFALTSDAAVGLTKKGFIVSVR